MTFPALGTPDITAKESPDQVDGASGQYWTRTSDLYHVKVAL